MAAVALLLDELATAGITVTPTPAGTLKLHGPQPALRMFADKVRAAKPDLLQALAAPLATDPEERAAIAEEGARIPRAWAEGCARLQCQSPPPGCSRAEWLGVIDAAGWFLDAWATQATALGWTATDLFGCGPIWNRRDLRGLLTFIEPGAAVVAITHDTARIKLVSGAVQTYHRHAMPRAAPIWGREKSPSL